MVKMEQSYTSGTWNITIECLTMDTWATADYGSLLTEPLQV